MVQLNPSLQSAAVVQPPDPPEPPIFPDPAIPPAPAAPPDPAAPPGPAIIPPEPLGFPLLLELLLGLPPDPSPPTDEPPFPPVGVAISPPHPSMMPPTIVLTPSATASKFSMCFMVRLRFSRPLRLRCARRCLPLLRWRMLDFSFYPARVLHRPTHLLAGRQAGAKHARLCMSHDTDGLPIILTLTLRRFPFHDA